MAKKYVYLFKEGNANMRELLGGKGANLAEMTNLGMPVPQGFTVTTEACTRYYTDGKVIGDDIVEQIYAALAETEKVAGKKFGDDKDPFLVSVRSGARASMPGMMDTILNLGLTDVSVVGLANLTNNPHFAYDAYRRFIAMFSDVVMEIPKNEFEAVLDEFKEKKGVKYDRDLSADDLKEVVVRFKEIYKKHMGVDFPQDPKVQLMEAVKAVPFLGQPACHLLSPYERYSGRLGHCRQRAVHGLRQHGRNLRHGRCLHAQPLHGRKEAVR